MAQHTACPVAAGWVAQERLGWESSKGSNSMVTMVSPLLHTWKLHLDTLYVYLYIIYFIYIKRKTWSHPDKVCIKYQKTHRMYLKEGVSCFGTSESCNWDVYFFRICLPRREAWAANGLWTSIHLYFLNLNSHRVIGLEPRVDNIHYLSQIIRLHPSCLCCLLANICQICTCSLFDF